VVVQGVGHCIVHDQLHSLDAEGVNIVLAPAMARLC
jgi:hypothetical protein